MVLRAQCQQQATERGLPEVLCSPQEQHMAEQADRVSRPHPFALFTYPPFCNSSAAAPALLRVFFSRRRGTLMMPTICFVNFLCVFNSNFTVLTFHTISIEFPVARGKLAMGNSVIILRGYNVFFQRLCFIGRTLHRR